MFGFGNKRRKVRNDTFGPGKIRTAAMAGLGMLAWKWWRNRQSSERPVNTPERPYTEGSPAGSGF